MRPIFLPSASPNIIAVVIIALITTLSMTAPATASAQVAVPPGGVSVPSARLYGDQVMSATLGGGAAVTSLRVPAGLTPSRLHGMMTTTLQSGEAAQLMVGHRVIARAETSATSPFDVELTDADVVTAGSGHSIALSVQVLPQNAAVCATPTDTVVVNGLSVDFTGVQSAPTTVSTFFDATVSRIHVLVPSGSAVAGVDGAAAAGLSAVATLVHRFGLPGTRTATVDLSAGSAVAPRAGSDRPAEERVLRLVPGNDPVIAQLGTVGGVPELTLTGSKAGLAGAVLGFGAADVVLADGPRVAQLAGSIAPSGAPTKTLAALTGSPMMTLTGFGVSSAYVGVSQSLFGGPVRSVSLHVAGVSAVLPALSQARLSVSWNGYLLASKLLGGGDPLAFDAVVPAALIQRDNSLTFRLDASAGPVACTVGGVAPEVDIDATASTVGTSPGQLLKSGFGRFPQALGGVLTVGFGGGNQPTDGLLSVAGHYVSALQGATATALSVVPVDGASIVSGSMDSSAALLLDPSDAQLETLSAPLRLGEFRQVGGSQIPFGVAVPSPFAVLEAFESSSRDVLVAGAWAPSTEDGPAAVELMGKLAVAADSVTAGAVDPGSGAVGWAALSGDLLVTSAVMAPTLLDSLALAPQMAVVSDRSGISGWVWVVVGVLLLILLASSLAHRRRAATVEFVRRQAAASVAVVASVGSPSGEAVLTSVPPGSEGAGASSGTSPMISPVATVAPKDQPPASQAPETPNPPNRTPTPNAHDDEILPPGLA